MDFDIRHGHFPPDDPIYCLIHPNKVTLALDNRGVDEGFKIKIERGSLRALEINRYLGHSGIPLPSTPSILDIGCGSEQTPVSKGPRKILYQPHLLRFLYRQGWKCEGVDLYPNQEPFQTFQGDIFNLWEQGIATGPFDVINAQLVESSPEFIQGRWQELLDKVNQYLTPEGVAFMEDDIIRR